MGTKEIRELRQQKRSAEALSMARAELAESPQSKNDIWFLRAYAWALYDHVKALVQRYEAKELAGSSLSGKFADYMNEFANMADPLRQDTPFSHMLRLAGKVSRDWDDFLLFARWAGMDSFSKDDEKPFVTDDGKTIDSLKVRFMRAICRETAALAANAEANPELTKWGERVLAGALEADPDNQWLNYYQSKLHLARDERDQAIQRLVPVLRRQSRAAWPWVLLGDILETTRPEDALTCLIHATQLARKEQEVAKVRIRLATHLARADRFDEAARQAALAEQYRAQNNFRVPPELRQMLASEWRRRVEAAGTARDLPSVAKEARQLMRELDQRRLIFTLAVIDHINGAKALSYAATGADSGFVLLHHQFPDVAGLAPGAVIEVGYADGQVHDWRQSTEETISGFFEVIAGMLERHEGKLFAFVRNAQHDVYVPPALAKSFAQGEQRDVTCKAIRRKDKQGKIGWRAIRFVLEGEIAA